jgi:hypothetical protein
VTANDSVKTEKRQHPRYNPVGLNVQVTICDQESETEITYQGSVVDLSYSGIKIKLTRPMDANISNSEIRIDMTLPESGVPLTIRGIIRHLTDYHEYGLEFTQNDSSNKLDDLIFECIKTPS